MNASVYTTLITAQELAALPPVCVRVLDCRFDLQDPSAGGAQFEAGAIAGATYLHLERHLSAPAVVGRTGRHPLPDRQAFRHTLRSLGLQADTQLVAYDDSGGLFAARFWWMARWAGYRRTAVLDGGYRAWLDCVGADTRDGRTVASTSAQAVAASDASVQSAAVQSAGHPPRQATMQEVRAGIESRACTLLDARAADRFRGRNETIDPVAGHIPRAINAPFQDNLGADGKFLGRAALRRRFAALLSEPDNPVICYCGSGVSAAHDILAMVHAGLPEPALYAGSWSEWITDASNPIEM